MRARHDATELRGGLAAQSVGADGDEVVPAPRRADQPGGGVLLLGNEAAVLAQLDVAPPPLAAVVARGAVGVEPDQARQAAGAPVHLLDDLLVVDAFEELANERDARCFAALADLIQEAVGDQL